MKTKWAWKLAVLAIALVGLLSACSLFTNTSEITFDNWDSVGYDCYVEGTWVGWVGAFGYLYYDYTWSGASSTTVYVEVQNIANGLYDDLNLSLVDEIGSTVLIDFAGY